MALTGRFTFKRSLWGKIILQIEEEVRNSWPASRRTPFKKRWRNATTMDLTAPELRALMDLRFKPQYMAQYDHLAQDGEAAARGREAARPAEADDRSVEVERVSRFGRPQRSA